MEFHEDCRYFDVGERPQCTARMDLREDPVEIGEEERFCEGCRVYEIQRVVDCNYIGNFLVYRPSREHAHVVSDAVITCVKDGAATPVTLKVCGECNNNRL